MSAVLTPQDYVHFGVVPYDWQREAFLKSADLPVFALFAEPRCGKSKPTLDRAVYRHLLGPDHPLYVDACFIVSMPSGAPPNWANVEIPAHVPLMVPQMTLRWKVQDAAPVKNARGDVVRYGTLEFADRCERALTFKGLVFLLVNGEAITSEAFLVFLRRFFKVRRVAMAGDETTLIMKTWGSERAKKMRAIGGQRAVVAKEILDGTPVGEGPIDLFSQVGWLDMRILGHSTLASFTAHYAIVEQQEDRAHKEGYDRGLQLAANLGHIGVEAMRYADRYSRRIGRTWQGLKKDGNGDTIYRNLPELYERLAPWSYRVRRRDVFRGPQQVPLQQWFELTSKQRTVYDDLRDKYEAELRERGTVTAANVLERHLRLQMVTSNYWPAQRGVEACPSCAGDEADCPACKGAGYVQTIVHKLERIDPDRNPRLDALAALLQKGDQAIVWCRFHPELDDVIGRARGMGFRPAEFSGRIGDDGKEDAKAGFQQRRYNPIVATPRSAGRAIALPAAWMAYYTNEWSLLNRLQSQDRAEAPGNLEGTGIWDIMAEDTSDARIVAALRGKRKVSDAVLREDSGRWL